MFSCIELQESKRKKLVALWLIPDLIRLSLVHTFVCMTGYLEAKYWEYLKNQSVKCLLCPHECVIQEGKRGICHVRENEKGKLITRVYGKIAAKNLDPIEKKPLYHFYPGREILSVGTAGCNLRCFYCQNFTISQSGMENFKQVKEISPGELVQMALQIQNNLGIAFTYNEPTVFYEYMYDTSLLAKDKNLSTVMVTNGFILPEPLNDVLPYMDAFNVDLKSFSDSFYRKYTRSSLKPVLASLQKIKTRDKHLEITCLIIPGLNDTEGEFRKMVRWIKENLGETQVLHLSRYSPNYLCDIPPTPLATMKSLFTIARESLKYVYAGNIRASDEQNTYCHQCGSLVIERNNYEVFILLDNMGHCPVCGSKILNYL